MERVRARRSVAAAVAPRAPSPRARRRRRQGGVVGRFADHDSWGCAFGLHARVLTLHARDSALAPRHRDARAMSPVVVARASVDARWRASERVGTSGTRRWRRCAIAEARAEGIPRRGASMSSTSAVACSRGRALATDDDGASRERERARERDANETMMTDRSRARARSRRRQRAGTGRDRWRCV